MLAAKQENTGVFCREERRTIFDAFLRQEVLKDITAHPSPIPKSEIINPPFFFLFSFKPNKNATVFNRVF
jgi:hypothetical protein